ncbi:MAG: bifunctional UDP-N-acetylglucosamine diphosphorylase/glucosamine-1-phosphate N-acetyltransferase GlmU [Alphaproteobacteria bacterium]
MSLAVVILAAGTGSRMKSKKPKVMHELAGRPMISWLVDTVLQLKPKKIIVVVGPDMKDLQTQVKPHATVVQKVRNGTAGALKCALPLLKNHLKNHGGDVLVLLGDAPLVSKATLQNLIRARSSKSGMAVLGAQVADPSGYGRLVVKGNTLLRITEHKDASAVERKIDVINTGAFCIDGARLAKWIAKVGNKNAAKEYYITDLPAIAVREGAVANIAMACCETEARGCNTRADLALLEEAAQDILRARAMENGVSLTNPRSVTFHHDTKIASDVTIEPNVFFGPAVSIAAGVRIRAFSYLEGVKIGANAIIGPFARLRPETEIGEGARIGNFVEVKKSKIGKGAKISHLAYVGDCLMGESANFSAGAITVNYDGVHKHKTIIGKNTMIGSNVNLVAPVRIEDGAYIAAGSTITDNVPADALAIERGQASVKKSWAKNRLRKK